VNLEAWRAIAIIGWILFASAIMGILVISPHVGKIEGYLEYLVNHNGK
jgi:hypothetical protein